MLSVRERQICSKKNYTQVKPSKTNRKENYVDVKYGEYSELITNLCDNFGQLDIEEYEYKVKLNVSIRCCLKISTTSNIASHRVKWLVPERVFTYSLIIRHGSTFQNEACVDPADILWCLQYNGLG